MRPSSLLAETSGKHEENKVPMVYWYLAIGTMINKDTFPFIWAAFATELNRWYTAFFSLFGFCMVLSCFIVFFCFHFAGADVSTSRLSKQSLIFLQLGRYMYFYVSPSPVPCLQRLPAPCTIGYCAPARHGIELPSGGVVNLCRRATMLEIMKDSLTSTAMYRSIKTIIIDLLWNCILILS